MKRITIPVSILIGMLICYSFSDAADKRKIIDRDGQYVSYESGIICDEKTNLEWVAGPDKDTPYNKAKAWVESLSIEGGGWRLPTKDELKSLYKKGAGERNMTPLLKTTGWRVWSDEIEGELAAWFFNFYDGSYTWDVRESYSSPRSFAVRSLK